MSEEYSFSWGGGDEEVLRITANPSPVYPDTCRFTIDRSVYPDSAVHFANKDASKGSPLAENLFNLEAVDQVLIADNAVTVVVNSPQNWEEYTPRVASTIREQIITGEPPVDAKIKENLPPPEIIRDRIREIIDRDINPSIAAHGGFVKLIDVKGNNAYLEFGGGCQGCGMAKVTLKYGVERHLRATVPEIGEIFDITDHLSGKDPYHAPAGI